MRAKIQNLEKVTRESNIILTDTLQVLENLLKEKIEIFKQGQEFKEQLN